VVREHRDITTDIALRSARIFNTIPKFSLNLQTSLDLNQTEIAMGDKIINEISLVQMPV
jgi:plasmid maintenance system antidote protein VapI